MISVDVSFELPDPVPQGAGWDAYDRAQQQRLIAYCYQQLHLDPSAELSIAVVDEQEMERIHREWMDLPGPTDVMSFPMDELRPGTPERPATGSLGDIVLCPPVAAAQAEAAGHSAQDEFCLLTVHGLLHLLGHDHHEPQEKARMFALQASLLEGFLGRPAPTPTDDEDETTAMMDDSPAPQDDARQDLGLPEHPGQDRAPQERSPLRLGGEQGDFRAGFAVFAGRPNAGKSTLTNALVGEKVAITSDRPQTTRHTIRGIVHRDHGQLILVDTPGIHRPRTLLGQRLNDLVKDTLGEVDVLGLCLPADEKIGPGDRYVAQQLASAGRKPIVAIVTKSDKVTPERLGEQLLAVEM